ncbi:MAG: PIN domain-containing protein [Anaerolineae bacterium]
MNVYVETNFVLELALLQEQHTSCEGILALCTTGGANLALPAFCIAESYETLIRRAQRRTQIANDLAAELRQLGRSRPYRQEMDAFQSMTGLLARSLQEEDRRLVDALRQILAVASTIPLEATIVLNATDFRDRYKFQPQDAIVYASVISHLSLTDNADSCFINRNSRDFDDPDIVASLASRNCRMLFSFEDGYNYIRHHLSAG